MKVLSSTTLLLSMLIVSAVPVPAINEKVSVEMVNVYVSAMNGKRFVTDLKPEEIIVMEDGVRQKIVDFASFATTKRTGTAWADVPLTLAFVLDVSGSMGSYVGSETRLDAVKSAAAQLVTDLSKQDQMMLFGFHKLPQLIHGITNDPEAVKSKLLLQQVSRNATALFDSMSMVLEQMKKYSGRKILVLCTDGEDTSSHVVLDAVLDQLRASDVTIIAFGIPTIEAVQESGKYVLNKFAEVTGGYAFFPKSTGDLRKMLNQLRNVMRSQYSLWYSPHRRWDGSWRSIEISCRRPGVDLRYRSGYLAR